MSCECCCGENHKDEKMERILSKSNTNSKWISRNIWLYIKRSTTRNFRILEFNNGRSV